MTHSVAAARFDLATDAPRAAGTAPTVSAEPRSSAPKAAALPAPDDEAMWGKRGVGSVAPLF